MKILFIGGTGRISESITKLCIQLGYEVYLLNRGNRALPPGALHLQGDINDEAQVAALTKNHYFDAVANFINYTPDQVERDIRLFAGRTGQYVFISSASAYKKPAAGGIITESTPLYNPYWQYSRDKIACEERLVQEYRQTGFPITIVRPSHTYDRNAIPIGVYGSGGQWQVLKRILEGKPILVHGDGSSLWTLTHSQDFAKAFTGLLGNIHAIGEAVHITSDEVLTWDQIHMLIGRALGVEAKLHHVTSDYLVALEPQRAGPLWGDKNQCAVFDNSKIKQLVPDYCATIRFDTGIKWSVETFLQNPALQKEDADFDAFTEKVIKATTP